MLICWTPSRLLKRDQKWRLQFSSYLCPLHDKPGMQLHDCVSGKPERFKQYREKTPTDTQNKSYIPPKKSCNKIIKQISTWKIPAEKQSGEISDWDSLWFFLLPTLPLYPAVCDKMWRATQSTGSLCPSVGWGENNLGINFLSEHLGIGNLSPWLEPSSGNFYNKKKPNCSMQQTKLISSIILLSFKRK